MWVHLEDFMFNSQIERKFANRYMIYKKIFSDGIYQQQVFFHNIWKQRDFENQLSRCWHTRLLESLWMNISVQTPPTPPTSMVRKESNQNYYYEQVLYYVDVSRNLNTSEISNSNGLQ